MVCVQLVNWDGHCPSAAIFVVDVANKPHVKVGFAWAVAVSPRFGAGSNPPGALGTHEPDGPTFEFGDGYIPEFGTVREPFFSGCFGEVIGLDMPFFG